MALLTLKNVGKIYVSESNVNVGLRHVNLSFEKNEFVAVTGKSGSGKSTLLNIISGMDSYEEGELYIENQPTSHYLQSDFEKYREKYISFIFQDYNIIESFTVLQNVELALFHIKNKKERKKRALELIERVGLSSHIKHKGSKLSGGQKQRTVIARALAKDSPIILADEPTGNLDSESSKEIIRLLKEVSKDKLVIVVTHNFEEVEHYATRHIRIFDGKVESDEMIKAPTSNEELREEKQSGEEKKENSGASLTNSSPKNRTFRDGMQLGKEIFLSRPKLSVFLSLLLTVAMLMMFANFSVSGDFLDDINGKNNLFTHIEGRTVLLRRDGKPLTEEELQKIAKEQDGEYLHYDLLLDKGTSKGMVYYDEKELRNKKLSVVASYTENFGTNILGRYPEKADEVFLYLPVSFRSVFGSENLKIQSVLYNNMAFKITGVKYFYDNRKDPVALFTKEGFELSTVLQYFLNHSTEYGGELSFLVKENKGENHISFGFHEIVPSYSVPKNQIYVESDFLKEKLENKNVEKIEGSLYFLPLIFEESHHHYTDIFYETALGKENFSKEEPDFTKEEQFYFQNMKNEWQDVAFVHPDLITSLAKRALEENYTQASMFFKNDRVAREKSEELTGEEYLFVMSDCTYELSAGEAIVNGIMYFFFWIAIVQAVLFVSFLVYLCSMRTLNAFKKDVAIMRSMGIQMKTIRVGMYVRMFIANIPALILTAITAITLYVIPKTNSIFSFLSPSVYFYIILSMLLITFLVTNRQIHHIFSVSVKKALKGGEKQ